MDDKDRRLPLEIEKQVGGAIFEAVRYTVESITILSYLQGLMKLLDKEKANRNYQPVILQEVSNICHFQYSRAQAHLARHVQTGIGAEYFKRLVNVYDEDGKPKVVMRIKPEKLTGDKAHLQYVLRLCQSQTNASQAIGCINKLYEIYKSCPSAREQLQQREMEALGDVAVILSLIQELSIVMSIPPLSRKTGQIFLAGYQELHTGLNDVRKEVDLRHFSVPVNQLLESGMATKLSQLGACVTRKTGAKMEFYYQYIAQKCLAHHRIQSQRGREPLQDVFPITLAYSIAEKLGRDERSEDASPPQPPTSAIVSTSVASNTQPMHQVHASTSTTVTAPVESSDKAAMRPIYATPVAKKVFSTLFGNPEVRASISWDAFESTMVAMGFSVNHGVFYYTFAPPKFMPITTSFTVLRPRNSKIEGHLVHLFSRRLKKAYGAFIVIDSSN
ncbi:hypothetical protein V8C35DRAFT_307728 [Trichoderma chlorosporum]